MCAGDRDVAIAGLHRESNAGRHADRDVQGRWTEVAGPVPAPIGPKTVVGAFIVVLEDGTNRYPFTAATQLKRDVGNASTTKDFFGPELDLRSRAFGDGDVSD